MSVSIKLILLWLIGCDAPPNACTRMCESAERLTEECLSDWDLDWDAAGYEDARGFQNSCETWVWEQQQLISAAKSRGEKEKDLEEACASRNETLTSDTATCEEMGLWSEEL